MTDTGDRTGQIEESGGCEYIVPWRGRCGDSIDESADGPVCSEHAEKTCWCGEQAVKACSSTDGLVCGQPLCEDHGCFIKYRDGRPHDPDGREQYENHQEATA